MYVYDWLCVSVCLTMQLRDISYISAKYVEKYNPELSINSGQVTQYNILTLLWYKYV